METDAGHLPWIFGATCKACGKGNMRTKNKNKNEMMVTNEVIPSGAMVIWDERRWTCEGRQVSHL